MKDIPWEPWKPTPAQRAAAEVLADRTLYGAKVKTLQDGLAVVRTLEKRERRRYHIRPDGHVTIVEAEQRRSDAIARFVLFGGVAFLFTAAVLLIVSNAADIRTGGKLEWAGWLFIPVCAAAFLAHVQLQPGSDGDEWWETIGAPRD